MAKTQKLGPVTFEFRKMLALEAFDLFEAIRPGLAEAVAAGKIDQAQLRQGNMDVSGIARIISALPHATVKAARDGLFRFTYFTAPPHKQMPLAGNEELAFKDLEPIHVYQVIGGAFVENFTESLNALTSLMEVQAPPAE